MEERADMQAGTQVAGKRDLRATAGFILVGLSGTHGVFHWFNQSFLVMLPAIRDAFGLSEVGVGSLMTVRQTASGVITLPGGVLSDFLRKRWGLVLALCMAAFGVGWLVMGATPAFLLALVGLSIVAMASSMWHLPAMASLSHRFAQRRATALSLHGVGGNAGDIVGPVVTGFLLAFLTWRGILSIYAVVPLLLAFVVFWAFRDIGNEGEGSATPRDARTQFLHMRALLKNPALWAINAVVALRGMARIAFITFLPIYLSDVVNLGSGTIGLYVGLLTAVGAVSSPGLGYVSDRLGRKPVLVPGLLVLSGLSLLLVGYGSGILLPIIIALLGIFLFSEQPILTAAALDIVGHAVATTTLGLVSFSRFIFSAASPVIAGYLSQQYGLTATFQYTGALYAAAAVLLLFIPMPRVTGSPVTEGHHGGGHGHTHS